MSCSTSSGAVVDERAGGAAELVVEGDAGGEGEQALADPCSQPVQGAGAVAFEAEQVFERPEDALDALADRRQVRPGAGFVLAAGGQGPTRAGWRWGGRGRRRPRPSG